MLLAPSRHGEEDALSEATRNVGGGELVELALDLRWSWDHATDELWAEIDADLWMQSHNPWVILQSTSQTRLRELLAEPRFCERVRELVERRREYLSGRTWFRAAHPGAALGRVAYFCMEFALSEALPIYSGGLGNVAGDQLKAASDLGVPVVGVGLLYDQGYFRQVLADDGTQEELYPFNDPGQLPVTPVRNADGEWLRLEFQLPGFRVWLRAWQVRVGRALLYLLDSNDPANPPAMRPVTGQLYGGGPEQRLRQELVLGIGGWRLLQALRLEPEVCHLNEGHAAFAVLERTRAFMKETGQPFEVAWAATRAGNVFTTHTPVAAGFDRFDAELVEPFLRLYANDVGVETSALLALGRARPDDASEPFNMAYLAIRGSGSVNGVSRLHGAVSRHLFQPLFQRWPEAEVPVGSVTNGVHMPTWDSPEAEALWSAACGGECWGSALDTLERDIRGVSDAELWAMRGKGRSRLVEMARERVSHHLATTGAPPARVEAMRSCLDPDVLTLVFARRFATYKRPTLLLHDRERLLRILTDRERPVQLLVAGKAHPADEPGQQMIREWFEFVRRPEVEGRAIFLPDYDLLLAERLVQGADVWINTPRRPWEASGTSGMKVLVNGGLNLSELDGWWAEAFTPAVGWALGDGREHDADPTWDALEAEALYALLEREIVPAFYDRDDEGIPRAWIGRMRESMASLTPRFSANRAVREYTEAHYLPAAAAYRARAESRGAGGAGVCAWQEHLARCAPDARFGNTKVETAGGRHRFTVDVYLGRLDAESVRVELYAEPLDGGDPVRQPLRREPIGLGGDCRYVGEVPDARPATHYTPRIVPFHALARVPLEASWILWQDRRAP
jgi:starch phosphorylase